MTHPKPVYKVRVLAEDEDGSRDVLGEAFFPAATQAVAQRLARDEFWDERLTGHYLCRFYAEVVDSPCWYCLEREAPGECDHCGIEVCEMCLGQCCDGDRI